MVGGALAACTIDPPRYPMCYAPAGAAPDWTRIADGKFATELMGAKVEVDLSGSSTRIVATVDNATDRELEIRLGGEGTPRDVQIGETLRRAIDRDPGTVGPDYEPYSSFQPLPVGAGVRAVFYVDTPLGRDPSYGQYFVFTIEARAASRPVERRSLPLTANHVADQPTGR